MYFCARALLNIHSFIHSFVRYLLLFLLLFWGIFSVCSNISLDVLYAVSHSTAFDIPIAGDTGCDRGKSIRE